MQTPATHGIAEETRRTVGLWVTAAQVVVIALAGVCIAATWSMDRWHIAPPATIAAVTIASELTPVNVFSRLSVSGSFLGIVLASVLLGGGPAALLGVIIAVVGWSRSRERADCFRSNVAIYAWFPLLAGILFHEATIAFDTGPTSIGYYLLVFLAFLVALAVNFGGSAGYISFLDRTSFIRQVDEALVPLLSAELFSALLTLAAVYVAVHLKTPGLVLFGLVMVIFQYLVGELLTSKRRSEKLQRVATTDELTGLANRERFSEAVQERIAAAQENDASFGVMIMDLDRFKEINDTLGHHYGDVLLRDLGPRLRTAIGEGGVVARLGGDEFGILLAEDASDPAAVER